MLLGISVTCASTSSAAWYCQPSGTVIAECSRIFARGLLRLEDGWGLQSFREHEGWRKGAQMLVGLGRDEFFSPWEVRIKLIGYRAACRGLAEPHPGAAGQ